jgi:L-ascorbate metabolism protein UlaG (beta-lactamase superfamily)
MTESMKITFLGHASLLIEVKEMVLLIDPFITGNDKTRGIVDVDTLKPDYILLTHAHQDHTLDAERIAQHSGATIISNYEIATYYEKKGFTVHPMNHGGKWKFPFGTLTYTNAIHTSSFPDGSYGGQPGGFILTSGNKNLYIAGDTALTMDMKLIPMTTSLNLAILPIGDNFTMGVKDAVLAAHFLDCTRVLGYHYDTFGFIVIDHEKALKTFKDAGVELLLPAIGESVSI